MTEIVPFIGITLKVILLKLFLDLISRISEVGSDLKITRERLPWKKGLGAATQYPNL